LNCPSPVWKKAKSFALAVTEANGWPAFTPVLLRTPGSLWANAIAGKNRASKNARTEASLIVFIPGLLGLGSALSPRDWRTSEQRTIQQLGNLTPVVSRRQTLAKKRVRSFYYSSRGAYKKK
jgi:hypothetical protein